MASNYITTASAAKILGVSEGTVRQMERKGVLPAERTDRGTRIFQRDAVERVAAERGASRPRSGEAA